jgi:hypothetical protein
MSHLIPVMINRISRFFYPTWIYPGRICRHSGTVMIKVIKLSLGEQLQTAMMGQVWGWSKETENMFNLIILCLKSPDLSLCRLSLPHQYLLRSRSKLVIRSCLPIVAQPAFWLFFFFLSFSLSGAPYWKAKISFSDQQ